jgi:hypothetical protein
MPILSCDVHLTVTLKPLLYRFNTEEQIDKSVVDLIRILNDLKCIKKTIVFELTKSHNIHYHIIAKFELTGVRNIYNKIYNSFRKSKIFGYVLTDQIKDYDNFTTYILKDVKNTFNILGRFPIIRDDYNLMNKFEFFEHLHDT